ncbi:SDR family oxidoreductase [Cellulomonas sp. HZM]|uniref:SDR family oxidoreductase n=1 Tax=Cellulomonas sp. HZM TaxID=1454010 RepID=UPI000492F5F0|nr:SDR family oxidoreductase [Cellulomonas sp. HZM]
MTVLVTGGTGVLGSHVVELLRGRATPARVLSRTRGDVVGDLVTGEGLAEAFDGVETVVHCASEPRQPEHDVQAAAQLLLAARAAGVGHVVYVSIVGVDRVPYSYYRAKLQVEELIADGGVPWSVLRATQFHSFVPFLLDRFTVGGITLLPRGVADQPVAVEEVAQRLVDLVDAGPSGRVDDLGGPEVIPAGELARMTYAAHGVDRRVVELPFPGKAFRALRAGAHLTPQHAEGRRTYAQWLAQSS